MIDYQAVIIRIIIMTIDYQAEIIMMIDYQALIIRMIIIIDYQHPIISIIIMIDYQAKIITMIDYQAPIIRMIIMIGQQGSQGKDVQAAIKEGCKIKGPFSILVVGPFLQPFLIMMMILQYDDDVTIY